MVLVKDLIVYFVKIHLWKSKKSTFKRISRNKYDSKGTKVILLKHELDPLIFFLILEVSLHQDILCKESKRG